MKEITLSSDKDGHCLILKGSINDIFSNRRANRLFKDTLRYKKLDDRDEIIVDPGSDLNQSINRIKKICEYIPAELVFTENVSNVVNNIQIEEAKFTDFSEKARSIRNNDCDIVDFSNFTKAVSNSLSNRTMYPLQLLSAYHLAFAQNACNFSVPGAGKTTVVYGAFSFLTHLDNSDRKHVDRLLIISPLSAFGPWEIEYQECFGKKPVSKRISGSTPPEERKQYFYSSRPAQITLISYPSAVILKEELEYFLQNNKVMVVLDEAHRIKNTSGRITAESILDIAQYCSARVVLTGTPAPNGYEDLYNLYKFIWPSKKIIPFEVNQLKDMDSSDSDDRIDRLIKSIEPFFIRIKKSDLNIPPAHENDPIYVPMDETQRRIYDAIERKYMQETMSEKSRSMLSGDLFRQKLIRSRLLRLMQAATNPNLLRRPLKEFTDSEGFDFLDIADESSFIHDVLEYYDSQIPPKFVKAREIIERIIAGHGKVVVWATFIENILWLDKYLSSFSIPCKTIYGATPVKNGEDDECDSETREGIINEFQDSSSGLSVIIANPFAVSESISLHKACHNAIYIERTFNAAHFIQSKDRIHRYGLSPETETNYYYLLSQDSIDETIHNRLREKEDRLKRVIESTPIPLFENIGLDTGDEDIKALIADYVNRTKKI